MPDEQLAVVLEFGDELIPAVAEGAETDEVTKKLVDGDVSRFVHERWQ